jgi:hypothetical protein
MGGSFSSTWFARLGAFALILLCLAAEAPGGGPGVATRVGSQNNGLRRNWDKHPAIVEIDRLPADLYAVSDVHGDYERLIQLLIAAQIIPEAPQHAHQVRWGAGNSLLVCSGDLIDKGKHSWKVIMLFRALQEAAGRAGGRVVVTMGNHEAAFLAGPENHKAKEFIAELDERNIAPALVAQGRDADGVGQFLRGLPLAVRVADWFFAHAGNARGRTLNQLRTEVQEGVDAHGYDVAMTPALDGLLEARLHPSPWWELDNDSAAGGRARLASYAKALGVRHLVLGHQPGKVTFADGSKRPKGTLTEKFDGLLFLIDTGMSRGLEGGPYSEGALLHVRRGTRATVIQANGKKEALWQAQTAEGNR